MRPRTRPRSASNFVTVKNDTGDWPTTNLRAMSANQRTFISLDLIKRDVRPFLFERIAVSFRKHRLVLVASKEFDTRKTIIQGGVGISRYDFSSKLQVKLKLVVRKPRKTEKYIFSCLSYDKFYDIKAKISFKLIILSLKYLNTFLQRIKKMHRKIKKQRSP